MTTALAWALLVAGPAWAANEAGPPEVERVESAKRPSAQTLRQAWERWRPQLNAHAVYPFEFSDKEWSQIAAGKVMRRRERLKGTDRVVGVIWSPADMETTWLAVQDPHGSVLKGFVEEDLPGSTFKDRIVYQSIDLPWPLITRQWVIHVVNNRKLLAATDDQVWERSWVPSDRRGAKNELERGIWLKVNEGGWFLAKAGEGTLLGYHARTVVGGIVPDEIATRWSFGTLSGMLKDIVVRIPWVATHYVGGHEPILRPGAIPIPLR